MYLVELGAHSKASGTNRDVHDAACFPFESAVFRDTSLAYFMFPQIERLSLRP